MKKVSGMFVALFFIISGGISAPPRFPFPQQGKYPYGILPSGVSPTHVQNVYDVWYKAYYEEQGDKARIKFDTPTQTVSEGIGYGMLIMVYMDNEKNNTQPKFDKLWNYWKSFPAAGSLMHWKINGFSGPTTDGNGSATDGDIDAALALVLAYYQWGDNKYLDGAKSIINSIKSSDISGTLLDGGSNWNAINPSYMSMVATQIFQEVDPGGNWGSIQSSCYSHLRSKQHGTTGMWPNWTEGGSPPGYSCPGCYGFDAARIPWRLGWAYVWFGHNEAKTMCGLIVNWFKSRTGNDPSKIGQIYNLDGTINFNEKGSEDNIPTYLGPLTVAGMVDANYQEWVNKGYTRLRAFGESDDNYYNECLELLSMLLLTGNMPDLTSATPKTTATLTVSANPSSAGSVTVSPQKSSYSIGESVTITAVSKDPAKFTFTGWSGDYEGTNATATIKVGYDMIITANFLDASGGDLVDDCEDGDGVTNMGSEWFTYTDVADKGKSTVTPQTVRKTKQLTMTEGGYKESKYAVKIEYKLDKGSFEYNPFVGVGFEMKEDSTALDISSSSGISFVYKGTFGQGDTCAIKCESESVTELGASYSYTLPPSTSWKELSLSWSDFLQPKWAKAVPLDLKRVLKVHWQIQGSTGESGELWLDDIHLIGMTISKKVGTLPQQSYFFIPDNKLFGLSQTGNNFTISYNLTENSHSLLSLHDLTGRLVKVITNGNATTGSHSIHINTGSLGLSNGNYIISLKTQEGACTGRIIINK